MSIPIHVRPTLLSVALAFLLLPTASHAANLMYLTGYGTESTFMGGADVAVSRDSFATNNNPAGLSQIESKALDLNWSVFDAEGATHSDNSGNYRQRVRNQFGAYGNLGYARHIPDSPVTLGVAFVVQGGLGWIYKNMHLPATLDPGGTRRDEATSLFSVVKLVPAASWKVNDRLSVGAALGLNYMAGSQTLFPNTSTATFSGVNFKDASGYAITAKFGLQYRPMEDVVIGLTYGSRAKIDLKGGTLRVNYTNTIPGEGVVRYDDAQLKGFGLPQELALGISFRPVKPLLVSIQDKWYDWSAVLKTSTLIARNPRSAGVPQQLAVSSQIGANDQHVYSLGAIYDWDDKLSLMGGVNYGGRAIPEQNLSPTFQAIQAMHYMAGVRYQFNREWFADAGIERLVQQMVTYNNTALPFGPSVANHSGTVLHMTASRRW